MKGINKVFYLIHQGLVQLAKSMMIAMTLIVFVQVVCRYVFNFSIRWSEEVPLILMVWFGFISMAIGVKKRLHISIELFYSLFPKPVQKVIVKVDDLLVMIFGLCMVFYGYKLAMFTMSSTLPATKLPTGWLYMAIPVAGLLISYDALMDMLGIDKIEEAEELEINGGEDNA